MIIVRYADDLVAGFEHEADANRFLDAMRARFAEFALQLHPDKTRLIEFGRLAAANREKRGLGKPETFNFLGFTRICAKSRRGGFLLKRKSRRDRVGRSLRRSRQSRGGECIRPFPSKGSGSGRLSQASSNTTPCPAMARALRRSVSMSSTSGGARSSGAVRPMAHMAADRKDRALRSHPSVVEVGFCIGGPSRSEITG